jgi:hypothetical protein
MPVSQSQGGSGKVSRNTPINSTTNPNSAAAILSM